jgi:hypothetical protein
MHTASKFSCRRAYLISYETRRGASAIRKLIANTFFPTTIMPISKKDRASPAWPGCVIVNARSYYLQIQREHKKADKAGTRAPVKANGLPVKAPKPTSIVSAKHLRSKQSKILTNTPYSARTAAAKSSAPTRSSLRHMLNLTATSGLRRNVGQMTTSSRFWLLRCMRKRWGSHDPVWRGEKAFRAIIRDLRK